MFNHMLLSVSLRTFKFMGAEIKHTLTILRNDNVTLRPTDEGLGQSHGQGQGLFKMVRVRGRELGNTLCL